ncbi:MAG TPA: hypothetical protein VM597_22535 [Gemmataceae bacterium]|jgi:hypothetical protein|nr:hypothetical protein [Gemmataceae bacterium]
MSKQIKNDQTPDPEDPTREFPRGTSASAGLRPEGTEDPADQPQPTGPWHPTKAGAAAEAQGRTTQEGAAEQTAPAP